MTDTDRLCFSCPLPTCYDEKGTPPVIVTELRKLCPLEQAEKSRRRKRAGGSWRAMPPGYLTVRAAAAMLGMAPQTVGEWCTKRKLPAERIQHDGWAQAFWAIPESAVIELIARRA